MVHSNTGIADKNWNPDGPKNAPDSWPAKFKYPPTICHDSTRLPEARGTCDVPLYKLEADCNAARGTWFPHYQWNPGEPPCCGGFNYDGTEQEACMCGPGTNRPCEDCPHDCRVVIGRYPFVDGPTTYKPAYLDLIFGCSTEEYCKRDDEVFPWVTGGCDCCGPCCPSMIGVRKTYEHGSFASLDTGHCYPIFTHKQFTDQASCEGNSINGVRGIWVSTDEDIPTPPPDAQGNYPAGACFEKGPVLAQGQILLPGGSRVQTGATTEAACNGVWIPITRINSSPPGCITPNKCSDNCGGSQIGVCHQGSATGPIIWGTPKSDCASPDVWSEDACNQQPPCCDKRGAQLYVKDGYEKLKAQISGCSCPGGGVCETDLTWLGGAGLPISISPWEKFGGIDPYKEVLITTSGPGDPQLPGQGAGDFLHLNTINLESTCGIWGGTFETCGGCGQYVALYDVDCPNCGYTTHPLDTGPGHQPGASNSPCDPTCIDFPAIQCAPACEYTLKALLPSKIDCHKCCSQDFGPPHGDCSGHCEDALGVGATIPSSSGFDCVQQGGVWKLDCLADDNTGGGGDPGIGGPGQGSSGGGTSRRDCGINCTNPSGGFYQCDCATSKENAVKFGIPLCRTVGTECGDSKCTMDAWAAPGTCCDWWTVAGDCASQQIINRGQRCGKGKCNCCEACPSCILDRYGNLTQADMTFDRGVDHGDWCAVEEEGSGCNLDTSACGPNAICHPKIKCNGISPIGKGEGATCECPRCPDVDPNDPCDYFPCNVGGTEDGAPIINALGNMPPACLCSMELFGITYHPDHKPKSIVDGKGACAVYCDGTGGPYWAAQLCPTPVSPPEPPCDPAVDDCTQAPGDLPGQGGGGVGGGGGGSDNGPNECAGCGDLAPRLIADCKIDGICGCGESNWTGRCDDLCAPSSGSTQTVYLICHQEAACKEDCDELGISREWRGECKRDRCGAKRGGNLCIDEGSEYWPPDPPHAGNDGKFRWSENPDRRGGEGYPVWGDESECPCGALDDPMDLNCGCPGNLTRGQIECMGATGRCNGGPHLEGVAPGGAKCQNHWIGTDRYACGHEWFTPPWGWPPVCGGGCGTHDFDPNTRLYGKLTESSESGVCQWPGPPPVDPSMVNCLGTGNPPLQQDNMIDLSSPFGTALQCMGDPEKDGRCSCDPGNWGSYSTKEACTKDGYDWITNTWVNTNGVCWHRSGERIFTKANGDLITDKTACEAMGSCTDASCQGTDCDLPACADKWSTLWREQNDPYWHDTAFAIANQGPTSGVRYPVRVSLLDYRYGGLGDSCYDGCMCGSIEPTCTAGGGCPDMPNCLGACFSCEGNEWEITEAECRIKVANCDGSATGGGTTNGGGSNGGTGGGYDPDNGAGGGGGTGGGGGGAGGGSSGSGYDWKPNPFAVGCFVPDEICKGCLTCDGNNADVCGGCGGKACADNNPSMQRPHCLSQQWCDGFPKVGKCGGKCPSFGCTGGGCGNYNPWNWKHRRCGKTCNQFHVLFNGTAYKAGYEDGAIKHLSKPNCRLFAPEPCCPDKIYIDGKDRPAPFVRIAQIDVEDYGEGYTTAPTVTIDDPTFVVLPDGITAKATAYVNEDEQSFDYGKLDKISIINKGLGYADPHLAAPDPITINATLSNGCAHIDANGNPSAEYCGVCVAREHKTKTECSNNVGKCTDANGNEVPEHRNLAACEVTGSGRTWVPTPDSWTPLKHGKIKIVRLEAWTGDCERAEITDKDKQFKNNAACDCIAFNDCIPGNPPDMTKGHRFQSYICDDIIMTSWEKLGPRVKAGNIMHIWKATNPKKLTEDPDELGEFLSMASSFNGDYEIERLSSGVPDYEYKMKLLCSGREVSAFQPECRAGYCKNCADGCPDPATCPSRWADCCKTGKYGPDRARCIQRRFKDSHGSDAGGCEGEWDEGTCGKQLPNCPTCDARGKCLYNGKCKDTNGDRNIHNGKCRGNEAHDAEHCTSEPTLAENIALCKKNCLNDHEDNCWDAAEGCLEQCCGCYDCQFTAVGLQCPACCWAVDAGGKLKRCNGGCSDSQYTNQVHCEANNKIWKEGPSCPDGCPQRKEDCCSGNCAKDRIITEVDVLDMGPPIIPFDRARPICGNPDHPDFGGFNNQAYRGLPSCEKCTYNWQGDWDEITGKCSNISTQKFRCGSYGHLAGGQETEWEYGCCEEKDCESDTCGELEANRGDCCGLWSTSACACPSNYKDCDGNIKKDVNGDPIRRPFVLDLAINGGAGGCCTTEQNIIGLIPGTYNNIGSFPQTQSRIIITEA